MSKLREQVLEFHRLYDQPIGEGLTQERLELRLNLIAEEFCELLLACGADVDDVDDVQDAINETIANALLDLSEPAEVFDALGDLDYVVEGFRVEACVDGGPIADEIHRSNLSKLGVDGKPVKRLDGKVVKGPNFSPPDIEGCLKAQGYVA
jgi:predicted HAD superfamily Cof-like phosphohydrolase